MTEDRTRERQYQVCVESRDRKGLASLGLMSNHVWDTDPKRLLFVMSRYKFVSRLLSGKRKVLEVGCADAFASRIVLQEVGQLTAIDFDPMFIQDTLKRMDERWKFDCIEHDILTGPMDGTFDGAFALDVLEHIPCDQELRFVSNIVRSLDEQGVLIIGTPSIQSQAFASAPSREGHINCKDATHLRELASRFFHNVFIFSMNDEVVHTGFYPMAHYLFALCCTKKEDPLAVTLDS